MNSMTPPQAGLAAFALALTFYWGVMNLMDHSFAAWYALGESGVTTTATVTAVTPSQKARCVYTYEVDGRTFSGHESGCAGLGIGGTMSITYLPADPSFATSRDPFDHLAFEIFAPLVLSTLAGFATAMRLRKKAAKAP